MHQSTWIWYYGEHALFHSLRLHTKGRQWGVSRLPQWPLAGVYPKVEFRKEVTTCLDSVFTVYTNGTGEVILDGIRYPTEYPVPCVPGRHDVRIRVLNPTGLPAAYAEGEEVYTDGTWIATADDVTLCAVGNRPTYSAPTDDVEVFPFSHETVMPRSVREENEGYLLDFGKELFAKLTIVGKGDAFVVFGESEEEALSGDCLPKEKQALLTERATLRGKTTFDTAAFRFIYIRTEGTIGAVYADSEYYPVKDEGFFRSDDPLAEEIFALSARTLHLNTRECFTDGIKCDGFVRAADLYETVMAAPALFRAPEISERSLLSLLGKPPYTRYVGGDRVSSLCLIISVYEEWFRTGNLTLPTTIFDRLSALYTLVLSERQSDGLLDDAGEDTTDCTQQILFWQATRCIRKMAEMFGLPCPVVDENALKEAIFRTYYRPACGGFAEHANDEVIARRPSIFAVLYGLTNKEQSKTVTDRVLLGDEIPEVNTTVLMVPELLALCRTGHIREAVERMHVFFGGMIRLGATTAWESFDPMKPTSEQYERDGAAFGASLCHACGAGPLAVFAGYVAGVRMTSVAGGTFEVVPSTDAYTWFEARVPLGDGTVSVTYREGYGVTVLTDLTGGTLYFKGKSYPLTAGEELTVRAGY